MPEVDLSRFVTAQAAVFDTALAEIRAGAKRSHWMWFIFPQIAGLGSSPTAQTLRDPVLRRTKHARIWRIRCWGRVILPPSKRCRKCRAAPPRPCSAGSMQ